MKALDKSAISALRSCMLLTTCSLVTPRCPISRRRSESGITPMTSPPLANVASAAAPIRPTQPPPNTMPILRSASSSPRRCAALRYAARAPAEEPQKTQILRISERLRGIAITTNAVCQEHSVAAISVELQPYPCYMDSTLRFGIKTKSQSSRRHGEELVHVRIHGGQ